MTKPSMPSCGCGAGHKESCNCLESGKCSCGSDCKCVDCRDPSCGTHG